MARYKLTLAYDGGAFHGWQKQEPLAPAAGGATPPSLADPTLEPGAPDRVALRTVQAVVERAVREVVREPVQLMGASRTDAGVHARGQVAAFTCSEGAERGRGWPPERGLAPLLRAINARLPDDVLATAIQRVDPAFDPIGDCQRKAYAYDVWVAPCRPLWQRGRVLHVWHALDVGAMAAAARRFEGRQDFAAFAAAGHGRLSTVRTVFRCEVRLVRAEDGLALSPGLPVAGLPTGGIEPDGDDTEPGAGVGAGVALPPGALVRIEIEGDGFLYNMVRIISGTLMEIGRGVRSPDSIEEVIASRDRTRAGQTLPPHGLCLLWARYE